MAHHTLALPTIAAALLVSAGAAMADAAAVNCAFLGDPDATLERVSDCMRMGRHVRVETNVSRGTATLGDGMAPAGLRNHAQHRVRVPTDPLSSFFSGATTR